METREETAMRWGRSVLLIVVAALALSSTIGGCLALTERSDPIEALSKGAFAGGLVIGLISSRLYSTLLAVLACVLLVTGFVAAESPGTVGRVLGVPTLDSGLYTLTLMIDRSSVEDVPIGARQYEVGFERVGNKLNRAPGAPFFSYGWWINGPSLHGWLAEPADLWVEGECQSFGVAEGIVKLGGGLGEPPVIEGRFTLVRHGLDVSTQ